MRQTPSCCHGMPARPRVLLAAPGAEHRAPSHLHLPTCTFPLATRRHRTSFTRCARRSANIRSSSTTLRHRSVGGPADHRLYSLSSAAACVRAVPSAVPWTSYAPNNRDLSGSEVRRLRPSSAGSNGKAHRALCVHTFLLRAACRSLRTMPHSFCVRSDAVRSARRRRLGRHLRCSIRRLPSQAL